MGIGAVTRFGDVAPVEAIYKRLAPVYDLIYGLTLRHGRRHAIQRLAPRDEEWILEVGVGTGLSAVHYPEGCRVAAIDLSASMIVRARARLLDRAMHHVMLSRMDAAQLAFPDACFDAVYAPYVMNVVPDPVRVAREMKRVCRPGGRIVLLNHFEDDDRPSHVVDRVLGHVAARAGGVNWKLDLKTLLRDAGLTARLVEQVNVPRVSSVVVCQRAWEG
jgi:phosphatidylethanolamine/phosphatidyl-N-methylethanolamine N-methyltransferase